MRVIRFQIQQLKNHQTINRLLYERFIALRDSPDIRRTHFFAGRYENIYIDRGQIPQIEPVLAAACAGAAEFLGQPGLILAVGYWFNEMQPGHITLPHRHDDDDELVSAAYYIRVPHDSGDLLLGGENERRAISPVPGQFVFFSPQLEHEVTENRSSDTRLSIGMNFGVRETAACQ